MGWLPLVALVAVFVWALGRRRNEQATPLRRGAVALLVLTGVLAIAVVVVAVWAGVMMFFMFSLLNPLFDPDAPTEMPAVDWEIATAMIHHPYAAGALAALAVGAAAIVCYGQTTEQSPLARSVRRDRTHRSDASLT